jgi:hypothetical protein
VPGEVLRDDLWNGPSNDFLDKGVAYGDGFVLVGSSVEPDDEFATIWTSPDGVLWTRLRAEGDLAGASIAFLATTGDGLLASGSREQKPRIWSSTDGMEWRLLQETPFGTNRVDGITASTDGFLAWTTIDGTDAVPREFKLAYTADGEAWSSSGPWPFPGEYVNDIASFRGGWLAVGYLQDANPTGGRSNSRGRAWWSPDGETWFRAVVPGDRPSVSQVFAGADAVLAVGGTDVYLGNYNLYRTTDGREWHGPVTDAFRGPHYATDGTRIVRWDHQGRGSMAWSADGETWHELGGLARPAHSAELDVGANGVVVRLSFADPVDDADVGVQYLRAE